MEIYFLKTKKNIFFFWNCSKIFKKFLFFNIFGNFSFLNRTLGLRKSFLNQTTYVLKKLVVPTIFLISRFFLKSGFLKSRFHCTYLHQNHTSASLPHLEVFCHTNNIVNCSNVLDKVKYYWNILRPSCVDKLDNYGGFHVKPYFNQMGRP